LHPCEHADALPECTEHSNSWALGNALSCPTLAQLCAEQDVNGLQQIWWQGSTIVPVTPWSKLGITKNIMHRHITFRQLQTISTCIQLSTASSVISNGPHIVVAISVCEYWQHVLLKAQ
jgi:hypothetical protein